MKYISIDIETTGLDCERNQIIEFGAVAEDTSIKKVSNLLAFRALVIDPEGEYKVCPYIMKMHAKLFEEIDAFDMSKLGRLSRATQAEDWTSNYDSIVCLHDGLAPAFKKWVNSVMGCGKIIVAGKNFYSFDHGFLKPLMGDIFHKRSLDPGILYMRDDDEKPPNLEECCKRAGVPVVGYHTAVGDARMVVELIRRRKT